MDINTDKAGHPYIDIRNVRVTFVPAKDRPEGKDWAGQDVLRFQAYKNAKDGPLHMGPEIPATEVGTILDFIQAVSTLVRR